VSGAGILGGERDVIFGTLGGGQVLSIGSGLVSFTTSSLIRGVVTIEWDGVQGGNGTPDRANALPATDLTDAGASNAFTFEITSIVGEWRVDLLILSGSSSSNHVVAGLSQPGVVTIPFATTGSTDFAAVTDVELGLR